LSALTSISASVQRHRSAAALAAVPIVAALIGALLGWALRGDAGPRAASPATAPTEQTFAAGDLRLTLPDGWTRSTKGLNVPGLDPNRIAKVSSVSTDAAISLVAPTSPALLPPPLAADARTPSTIRAGNVRAYRYVVALGANRFINVYAAPTTQGTAIVACSSAVYELGECQAVLGALRLARGAFIAPSPNAAMLEMLPIVVGTLNNRRAELRARLADATSPDTAAGAADELANAYAQAAEPLRPLIVRAGAPLATIRNLQRLRAEHVALANALRIGDRVTFTLTAERIRADEARLDRRLAAWQRALRAH
jgi:hypothetical protein